MKNLLMAGTAITAFFACTVAIAQPMTNTPALLRGTNNAGEVPTLSPHTPKVLLEHAVKFAILSESGITDVSASAITGRVGTSPITGAADLLNCAEVTGEVLSVDADGPAPCSIMNPAYLGIAVGSMETAYTDAAGRAPDFNEVGGGNIGGLTLAPGVYRWSGNVIIPANVTFTGNPADVWILQIAGNLDVANGQAVILGGGAQAKHIYWQVAGAATLGTTSHLEGTVLGKTMIALKTGASVKGRLLAQTAVTLQKNSVIIP